MARRCTNVTSENYLCRNAEGGPGYLKLICYIEIRLTILVVVGGLTMRRVCFAAATVAATIGFCSVASRRRLAETKAPAYKTPVAVPYNWTGWYVGGNVGYARARSDYDLDYSDANAPFGGGSLQTVPRTAGTGSLSRSGAIGGLQVGYNQQFNQLVLGLEADFSFSSLKSSSDFNGNFPNFGGCGSTFCGGTIAVTTSSRTIG